MRATGIVRRVDDLGRVVIPRDLRRSLKIREGDPLEIFTTPDGGVVFQKYHAYDESEWGKLKSMLRKIMPNTAFAILDGYGENKAFTNREIGNMDLDKLERSTTQYVTHPIHSNGDTVAYLVVGNAGYETDKVNIAIGVMSAFLDVSEW